MKNKLVKAQKSSFIEGTFIATLAIILTKILGMLYVIPFYAIIGNLGSSLYSYGYNIYVIFLEISSAGIPIAISKIIKEYNTLGYIEAKVRAYHLGQKLIFIISIIAFLILFILANPLSHLILGDLQGGNKIEDITNVIRSVSFAILVIPLLSVKRGYLQGHNIINVTSISQIIEQVIRILFILLGSYLSLKVFKLAIGPSISIAIFGACAGGLLAFFYINHSLKINSHKLDLNKSLKKNNITNKEIFRKIINYSIPFIVIDVSASLYNFIDMVLITRTMNHLGYLAKTTEFVTSSVVTWSAKIGMIINAIASGLKISLIPNIVEEATLKNYEKVGHRFNQSLQLIILISLPMTIGISLLSKPIWSLFYGYNELGANILQFQILTSLVFNINIIAISTLQSLNKFKTVYICTFIGYLINAIFDVPLMILFNHLGYEPFYGALLSTLLGTIFSIIYTLFTLKKDHQIKYHSTLNMLKKLIYPIVSMIIVVLCLSKIIPVNIENKLSSLIYVIIISISGGVIYLYLTYKTGLLSEVIGKKMLNKIIKKLTLGKVSLD